MQVKDLIEQLEQMSPDAEVRIASVGHRSHFQYHLGDVVEVEVSDTGYGAEDDDTEFIVYIEEGGQEGYLKSEAREALRF